MDKIETNWLYTDKECQRRMFLDSKTYIPGKWCMDCECLEIECPYKMEAMRVENRTENEKVKEKRKFLLIR